SSAERGELGGILLEFTRTSSRLRAGSERLIAVPDFPPASARSRVIRSSPPIGALPAWQAWHFVRMGWVRSRMPTFCCGAVPVARQIDPERINIKKAEVRGSEYVELVNNGSPLGKYLLDHISRYVGHPHIPSGVEICEQFVIHSQQM